MIKISIIQGKTLYGERLFLKFWVGAEGEGRVVASLMKGLEKFRWKS